MFGLFRKKQPPVTENKALITADMSINEIIEKYPISVKVLAKYGISCAGCHSAKYETLRQGVAGHGVALQPVLDDLNRFATDSQQ